MSTINEQIVRLHIDKLGFVELFGSDSLGTETLYRCNMPKLVIWALALFWDLGINTNLWNQKPNTQSNILGKSLFLGFCYLFRILMPNVFPKSWAWTSFQDGKRPKVVFSSKNCGHQFHINTLKTQKCLFFIWFWEWLGFS